jgi:hypothetical protein
MHQQPYILLLIGQSQQGVVKKCIEGPAWYQQKSNNFGEST